MKNVKRKKSAIAVIALLLLAAAYALYSRPMDIAERYLMLTPEKCTGISGYYYDGEGTRLTNFTVEKDSEAFARLWELFYEQDYRRTLRDLFPRGSRTKRYEPGDFQWEVFLEFEDVELPDGSRGSGAMLQIQYWYGELDIDFDGENRFCRTKDQDAWAKEVLDIIR